MMRSIFTISLEHSLASVNVQVDPQTADCRLPEVSPDAVSEFQYSH